MRKPTLLLLAFMLILSACRRNSASAEAAFTGNVRMVTPFTQPSVQNGQLFLSNGRLRVELGPMVTVYIASQQKGWQLFPEAKLYLDIGEKQVSTFLPRLTNGSPCPNTQHPADCKMLVKESMGGRQATKWLLINQHGEPVYVWTDNELGIALRWEIENVTYEVSGIHETTVSDSMFELPSGYTPAPWKSTFLSQTK